MLTEVPVREVMETDVQTAAPDDTVAEAAAAMTERDVGSVVVVAEGEPTGILTYSDVVALVAEASTAGEVPVGDVASSPLRTVEPDATVEEVAHRLSEEGVNRLPVVEDGALVGVVSVDDVSYYLPTVAVGRRTHRRTPPGQSEVAFEEDEWVTELDGDPETTQVGDVVRFSKTLDDEDVHDFAHASGDTNRLHLDDDFAGRTRFGGRIAHGTLAAGLISAALARLPGLTIYLSQDLTFEGPVPIGGRVTGICEVVEQLGEQRYRCNTMVCHDGDPVIDGEATVLIDPIEDAEPLEEAEV